MSRTPAYPTLPDVSDDVHSLRAWTVIATQILRTLTGETGVTGHANQTIITRQTEATQPRPVGIRNGDLWIALPTTQTQTLQRAVWVDGDWIVLNGQW